MNYGELLVPMHVQISITGFLRLCFIAGVVYRCESLNFPVEFKSESEI